ncbi:MAG: hypothetical protein HC777_00300 [Hyphomonadaceae bacterium]|nr:hypothetical protein [Hyphomonadaceae bacterium]
MSLPSEYLDYPRRQYGQDIDRYDWRQAKDDLIPMAGKQGCGGCDHCAD